MWKESAEPNKHAAPPPLRTGLTTGTCATACVVAAAKRLLTPLQDDTLTESIPVLLPTTHKKRSVPRQVHLTVRSQLLSSQLLPSQSQPVRKARAETIKDAGDDPDVTHGATVFVIVSLTTTKGIVFEAGDGVGVVTREGLALAVGEPAINPVPRQMMTEHLQAQADQFQYQGGFRVEVGIENGANIALKTMNPRLGIEGGLSILGTTGIVRPFSCAAWIASIYQGIDVAVANDVRHIAATTGNASERAIKDHYQLQDMALIEMGDFAGAVLKHLKKQPVSKLTLCGGFGKITKLANRHMDLNSRVSSIDFEHIAQVAAEQGADTALQEQIAAANTSIEAYNLCHDAGVPLADALCLQARHFARNIVPDTVAVEVWAIDRKGRFIGHADWG